MNAEINSLTEKGAEVIEIIEKRVSKISSSLDGLCDQDAITRLKEENSIEWVDVYQTMKLIGVKETGKKISRIYQTLGPIGKEFLTKITRHAYDCYKTHYLPDKI